MIEDALDRILAERAFRTDQRFYAWVQAAGSHSPAQRLSAVVRLLGAVAQVAYMSDGGGWEEDWRPTLSEALVTLGAACVIWLEAEGVEWRPLASAEHARQVRVSAVRHSLTPCEWLAALTHAVGGLAADVGEMRTPGREPAAAHEVLIQVLAVAAWWVLHLEGSG